jgi:hypothetical protein
LSLREDFAAGAEVGNASVDTEDAEKFGSFSIVAVRLRTLDSVFPNLGLSRIDIAKIDIEGHEDHFLAGAAVTLARYRPVMLMEINRWFYERRGVECARVLSAALPEHYRIFRMARPRIRLRADDEPGPIQEIAGFGFASDVEDVFLVPAEKVQSFRQAAAGARR